MRHRSLSAVCVVSTLLVQACGDRTLEDQPEDLCALDQPSLLVPLPADWDPSDKPSSLSMWVAGDHLLYGFDGRQRRGRRDLVDLCGGKSEPIVDENATYTTYSVMDSEQGPVLYGWRDYALEAIDRLEVAGRDVVRRVGEISPPVAGEYDLLSVSFRGGEFGTVYGFSVSSGDPDPVTGGVAGIGGGLSRYYFHSGDPDTPTVLIGDDIVRYYQVGEQVFMLGDDGGVERFDRETGTFTHILDGARYIESVWDSAGHLHLLYQVLGDDESEAVRVRDLETGAEREVTVNDFASESWGRGESTGAAGSWVVAAGQDTTVLALRGPDSRFAEAYRLDTLEPLAIPEHDRFYYVRGLHPGFGLVLPDPEDHVIALWDALTGTMAEIYRGPAPDWRLDVVREGDRVVYERPNADGSMRRIAVDLTSGAATTVIPRLGTSWLPLADGRLLSLLEVGGSEYEHEIALVDPDTGDYEVLVERTLDWGLVEDVGIVYLDLDAPEPGIWTLPFPPR